MATNHMLPVHAPARGWEGLGDASATADLHTQAEQTAASIPDATTAHLTLRALMPWPGIPGEIPKPATDAL